MAKKKSKSEITVSRQKALAVNGTNKIDEMFGGGGVQIPVDAPLPAISIMRESAQFEMPDGEYLKEFTGHILYWHNANQYYSSPFGEGESLIPDCSSSDGIKPDGGEFAQNMPCRQCQYNKYGSADEGTGKACQNTIRLYILVDGEVIPSVLKAPPSSLGKKEPLMRWLTTAANIASKAGMGTKYQPIQVKFSLRKKEFASGMTASVIGIETIRVLDMEADAEKLQRLSGLYKDFTANYLGRISKDVCSESAGSSSP